MNHHHVSPWLVHSFIKKNEIMDTFVHVPKTCDTYPKGIHGSTVPWLRTTPYDGFCNPSILTGDKGTLTIVDALHWSFTFLFSTRGLLHVVYPLVTVRSMGCRTSDIFLVVSETACWDVSHIICSTLHAVAWWT